MVAGWGLRGSDLFWCLLWVLVQIRIKHLRHFVLFLWCCSSQSAAVVCSVFCSASMLRRIICVKVTSTWRTRLAAQHTAFKMKYCCLFELALSYGWLVLVAYLPHSVFMDIIFFNSSVTRRCFLFLRWEKSSAEENLHQMDECVSAESTAQINTFRPSSL